MSLILALISRHAVLVASDGLRRLPNGVRETNHNRTFELPEVPLIGVNCGTFEIDGKSISAHLGEITGKLPHQTLEELVAAIAEELKTHLATQLTLESPRLDLLLVGRTRLKKGVPQIRALELALDPETKSVTVKTESYVDNGAHAKAGDEQASKSLVQRLRVEQPRLGSMQPDTLKKFAEKAMRHGIEDCSKAGEDPSCLGGPYILIKRLSAW